MRKTVRFYAAAGLMLLGLPCSAPAQSSNPLPTEPYLWRNVVIGGGGFVTGIIAHPRQNGLVYARTDVGGAYRWDPAAHRWQPLTDGIGDVDLTGIESLAVDPSDPDRVYLAAGIYSRGKAAILRSADQGRTWLRTDVPFKMGGNEAGRFNGEQLAVDPNDGAILFFGSRHDGLWKSADRGETWQKVDGFSDTGSHEAAPADDSRPWFGFNQQPVGIVCVLFDRAGSRPGNPTPTLYAAVSTTGTNLYRSTDGGVTWLAVPDQPVGLRPNHLVQAPDETCYLTYGKEPGPNTMTDGAVWKFNPKTGDWTDITPVRPAQAGQPFGYGAVAVDAQHPSTVMVTTFAHWQPHDEIFRSTNAGASWTQIWQDNTQWYRSRGPYTATRTPHWMGSIVINPFNPDQVLFSTGFGIWSSGNMTQADAGQPTVWAFLDAGLEETVPLALISPPEGAHLLSGVGDIDGFRHDDLDKSPAEGTFSGPRYGNTEDLAFAGENPQVIVRTGTGRSGVVRAAISTDGGKTWSALGSEPTNSAGAGAIAISADGKDIVWTPRRSEPHYSTDQGTHWTACAGLAPGVRVIADPVDPAQFYACDARAGRILISTNGAASFIPTTAVLPAAAGFGGGFGGASALLSATPGMKGDLWLVSRANGLFHSGDAGATFTKLNSVTEANSLGFGKAAPGQKYPALYLAGKVGNLQALFRSDDAGTNWVRINDEQHQYGWISHVTGDPRIYGRVYFATGGRGIIYGDKTPNQE
ncbi:MAG: cellulase [Limisphaerales bacterium]